MSKLNGEVVFTARDGKTYTLLVGMNAFCEFEAETGKNALEAFSDQEKVRLPDMRAMFWAALLDYHPNITLREAGRIYDQDALLRGMAAAAPQGQSSNDAGNDQAAA